MFRRILGRSAMVAALPLLLVASAASAKLVVGSMAGSGGGTAAWVHGVDAPGDTDGQAVKLIVPSGGFAGFNFAGVPAAIPGSAPSFAAMATTSGAAGGAPRLVITFANGDNVYTAPNTWTAGAWATVGGSAADWHDAGLGGCTEMDGVAYAQAIACAQAAGSSVTGAYLVDDAASTVYVDDFSLDGTLITENAAVKAAHTFNTTLSGGAKVNSHGVGAVRASCGVKAGCHFRFKLTVRPHGKTVSVGTLIGNVNYGHVNAPVKVHLNTAGRHLLAQNGLLVVTATGKWPGTRTTKHITFTIT